MRPSQRAVLTSAILLTVGAACEQSTVGATDVAVVYGGDDRRNVYEISEPALLYAAQATVVLVRDWDLTQLVNGSWELDVWRNGTNQEAFGLCDSEAYIDEPVPGFCSGFMVGDDLIATAGHCIETQAECNITTFVFGFQMIDAATPVSRFSRDDVYACAEVVEQDFTDDIDYAILRVDRAIVGHTPGPLRRDEQLEDDSDVSVLFNSGHPAALPMKIVGGSHRAGSTNLYGAVLRSSEPFGFSADLDLFVGSSGSMTFSVTAAGEFRYVEGLLSRGNDDYVATGGCNVVAICSETQGCMDEDGPSGWEDNVRSNVFAHVVPPCEDDACGVCNGDGASCAGCDGVPYSGKVKDVCGVCDGDGTSCVGCDGVANSGKVEDACGVCDGDGSSCAGCDGVPNSGKVEDACGVCDGDGLSCVGCDGVANSGKVEDPCGVCDGDGSSCAGCDGVPNSGQVEDECGVCGGDGASCAGCDGVANSGQVEDECGVCGGDGASCAGCDGVANSGKAEDACGVCDGDGSTCAGCDGMANSGKVEDACGMCGGDGSTCAGCDGVPNSGKVADACGVCGGDGSSCARSVGTGCSSHDSTVPDALWVLVILLWIAGAGVRRQRASACR